MNSNRLTIIPIDNAVYMDAGVQLNLDFSDCGIPEDVHALQWLNGSGWIEYIDDSPNMNITEIPTWAVNCVNKWQTAYDLALLAEQTLVEQTPAEDPPV